MACFVCYNSPILGPTVIRTFENPPGPLTGTSPKLKDLVHSVQFSMLLLTDFGSLSDPNLRETRGLVTGTSPKSQIWLIVASFLYYYSLFLVPMAIRMIRGTPGSGYGDHAKTRTFGSFWLVFYAVTQ